MYIIYDKTSTENGRVIIIELKGKKCEGILIFGTGFHVLEKKKWSHIQTNRWIKQSCCQTLKWSVKPKCYILTSIREQ